MVAIATYPPTHRSNLVHELAEKLTRTMEDEELGFDRAFAKITLNALGISFEGNELIDGKGDHGIDFGIIDTEQCSIYQFKSQNFERKFRS
jgi:hypothetical protein